MIYESCSVHGHCNEGKKDCQGQTDWISYEIQSVANLQRNLVAFGKVCEQVFRERKGDLSGKTKKWYGSNDICGSYRGGTCAGGDTAECNEP